MNRYEVRTIDGTLISFVTEAFPERDGNLITVGFNIFPIAIVAYLVLVEESTKVWIRGNVPDA